MKILAAIFAAASLVVVTPDADAHYYTGCKKAKCKRHVIKPYRAKLYSIHSCETRGLSGRAKWRYNGVHDGAFQFSPDTWSRTGSRHSYAWQAPRREQKYRAVVWAGMIGWAWGSTAGWPICGD